MNNIINTLKLDRIERKLDNGLIEVKILFDTGQLSFHYFLDENGLRHGEYKSWYRDGTLGEHCYYEHGERHGEFKWWYDDGTLGEHCHYVNSLKHGELIKEYK